MPINQQWSRIAAFLKKNPVGLDISDRTIEMVELAEEGKEVKITNMSRALLPKGIVERGRIKDANKLALALDQAMKNARPESIMPKKIIFGIPEGQMYTHVFELVPHKREDRDQRVKEEVRASIPLQEDEALFAYTTLYESSRRTGIALIAVNKTVFAEWQNFFKTRGFEVEMYESEIFATARGLFSTSVKSPVCVVDIGSATATIALFSPKGLQYVQSFPDAGDAITLSLSKELNILPKDAEHMKIKVGLSDEKNQSFFIMVKVLQAIAEKVKTSIDYFQDKTGERVGRVVLIGGSAKLKGIREYFEENLNISVWLGESVFLKNQAFLEYIEATGLALRGLQPQKFINDPAFIKPAENLGVNKIVAEGGIAQQMINQEQGQESVVIAPLEVVEVKVTQRQQLVLLSVLVAGVISVLGAAGLRDRWEERSYAKSPPARLLKEMGIQILNVEIPISVLPEGNMSSRGRGHIFESVVAEASGYLDALSRSRAEASSFAKQSSKTLWQEPINPPKNPDDITFPLRIKWLLYSENEVADLFLQKVFAVTNVDVHAASPHVTVLGVVATADPNVFSFQGRVRILTSDFVQIKKANAADSEMTEKIPARITVLDTPVGWLNARDGPGTDYKLITRIYPGEKYILLEERGEWYKIDLGGEGGRKAWVHSQYAQKE